MKSNSYTLLVVFLFVSICSPAATTRQGKERLRELVVTPKVDLSFKFDFSSGQSFSDLTNETSISDQVARLRGEVKQSPDDARLHIQLGSLLYKNSETNAANVCFQKAAVLAEKHLSNRPLDGLSQVDWGDACWTLGKKEAAEHAYRKATQVSSNEWWCWVALGNFLDNQVGDVLWLTNRAASGTSSLQGISGPSPAEMECVMKWRVEASPCFDRAVALAPQEVEVYLRRAWHKGKEAWANRLIQHYRAGEKLDRLELAIYSKDAIPDLKKAATLQPQAYQLIGLAAYFEWASGAISSATATGSDQPPEFSDFSTASRRSIVDAMARLSELGNSKDPRRAAGALEMLAGLRMLTQIRMGFDNDSMVRDMKRAVSLDPTREGAWDLLLGGMLDTASPEEFAQVCETRLKQKKSARNSLLLAKAWYRCSSYTKAIETTEAGLKLDSSSLPLHLMLAASLIRQDREWEQVQTLLDRSGELLAKMDDSEEKPGRAREFALNLVVALAIHDRSAKAKSLLEEFLRKFPDDEEAKEILSAIP